MVYSTSSTLSLSSPRVKAGFPAPFRDMPSKPQSFVVLLGSFLGTKTNFNNFQRCVNFNMIAKTVSVDHSRAFFTWQSLSERHCIESADFFYFCHLSLRYVSRFTMRPRHCYFHSTFRPKSTQDMTRNGT